MSSQIANDGQITVSRKAEPRSDDSQISGSTLVRTAPSRLTTRRRGRVLTANLIRSTNIFLSNVSVDFIVAEC